MKTNKIIILTLIVTVISIGYVHQKVEIIKSGYDIQKSRKYLSSLVDQNSNLMYNLSKLESPRYLLTSLNGEEIKFVNHRTREDKSYQIAQVNPAEYTLKDGLFGKFLDLFTLNAEARPRD
jgi:hypothetical protein